MAISYVSVSSVYSESTSITVTAPASIQDNDILVAFARNDVSDSTSLSLPTGFTSIATQSSSDYKRTQRYVIGWKRASSESGDYAFGQTGTDPVAYAAIIVLRGCLASGSPVDVYSNTAYTTSNTTIRAASVTTTVANTMLVAAGGTYGVSDFTPPTGMTERLDVGSGGCEISMATVEQASTGASGAKDFTYGSSQVSKHAFLVAFKPDSAGNPWYAYAQQ